MAADSDNHRATAGGNGHGVLSRPISELSDQDLAELKQKVGERLRLQETAGDEAAATSERFKRIIEEIEG
jgi:hypothetical protein